MEEPVPCDCDWRWSDSPCTEKATHFFIDIQGKPAARCSVHYPSTGPIAMDITKEEFLIWDLMKE
jgi:hypothetical protein